jgi:hypothetical protein
MAHTKTCSNWKFYEYLQKEKLSTVKRGIIDSTKHQKPKESKVSENFAKVYKDSAESHDMFYIFVTKQHVVLLLFYSK